MTVKVVITRRFKEGKGLALLSLLNKLRGNAMNQPGYITGETLVGHDDPHKLVVIGTWQSVDHWLSWKNNEDRTREEKEIEHLLEDPARYEVFSFGTFPHRD